MHIKHLFSYSLFKTESACKEFELISTGGILEYKPFVLGTYTLLTNISSSDILLPFRNDRVVYKHGEDELYLYSIEFDNEEANGMWVV